MKILLDTNIFIYRESHNNATDTVAKLFAWFDKLKYEKVISPITEKEINGYTSTSEQDKRIKNTLLLKIKSYANIIDEEPTEDYLKTIKNKFKSVSVNSEYDNHILYQVVNGVAGIDVLLTNDQGIIRKSEFLNIRDKVLSPNELLSLIEKENPEKIDYPMLSIKKCKFGNLNFNDIFFDSLKEDYEGIEKWFKRKNTEDCYILRDKDNVLKGFLYIKLEDINEDYTKIDPIFGKNKRLKIGTFKIDSTGFRAGERFLKIIFEYARLSNVDEVYVTMFDKRTDLKTFFSKWGFKHWGNKTDSGELVYIKDMKLYDTSLTAKQNTPLLKSNPNYFILPIEPEYHTDLFPDSILKNENEHLYNENLAHRYALSKNYITGSFNSHLANKGDVFLIYRKGDRYPKTYSGCITTVCILEEVITPNSKQEFLNKCENRTIFSIEELAQFWDAGRYKTIVKMVEHINIKNKVILKDLLSMGLTYNDLRPFSKISKENYDIIMSLAN